MTDSSSIPMVYPGATWETRTPEEVGLSRAKLDALRDGCITQNLPPCCHRIECRLACF